MTEDRLNTDSKSYACPQRVLLIGGLLSVLAYGYLAFNSQAYAEVSFYDLCVTALPTALISFYCFYYLKRHAQIYHTSPFYALWWIIGFAILFRIIGIATYPVLEDDFFRYLWDGRMLIEIGTPYGIAPSEFFDNETLPQTFETILDSINHPYIATVYGPVCQWFFGLAYWIAPGALWPLKVLFALVDIAIIFSLHIWLKKLSLNHYALILYAWSPLVIKEIAMTAHPDVLAVGFSIAALLALSYGRNNWAVIAIALAVGSKVFALILVPYIARFFWQRWLLFFVVVLAVSWPLGLKDAWLPEGLSAMAEVWFFNAPLYALLGNVFSFTHSKLALLSLFGLVWLVGFYHFIKQGKSIEHVRFDYLFAVFLICIPVLNAWYLLWLLPFAVLFPSYWAWTASISVFLLSYMSGINSDEIEQGLYDLSSLTMTIEYGLVVLALAYGYIQRNANKPYKL